jgi:hypothetical protein
MIFDLIKARENTEEKRQFRKRAKVDFINYAT